MNDEEFRLLVTRNLEEIRRGQQGLHKGQDRLLRTWSAVLGLLILLAVAVLALALIPGQQLVL